MAGTGQATINFGTWPGSTNASATVTGQAAITGTSLVEAWIFPATTADHNPDEHWVEDLTIAAGNIVAGTGFTIYAMCNKGRAHGLYNIAWVWN